MKPLSILSLFDGMSCGQIALREIGVPNSRYFASEVDRFAIAQTQLNFPDTIQLGYVRNVDVSAICEKGAIDMLIGGSPCQSFSFAGKRAGMKTTQNEEIYTLDRYLELKRDGFEFEGQSYLFWEYMRILTELRAYNPKLLFLLENVEMGKKWERVLSDAIGIRGVHINSALVSAQNRRRIYWTNIRVGYSGLFGEPYSDIPQPADRGILLKDILEENVDEKYFLSEKVVKRIIGRQRFKEKQLNYETDKLSPVLRSGDGNNSDMDLICIAMRGRNPDNPSSRKSGLKTVQMIEPAENGKTNCLTSVSKDNLILYNDHLQKNLTDVEWKANSLLATSGKGAFANGMTLFEKGFRIRRITPTECARLQTIPEWYKWGCSETQQYRMLGNGWTVEVIKHIFSFIDRNNGD